MVHNHTKVTIFLLLLVIVKSIDQISAECCPNAIAVIPNCYSAYGCFEYICADGTPLNRTDNFCGVGACNIFGCSCDGGCRQNSKGYDEEEARRLYRIRFQKFHWYLCITIVLSVAVNTNDKSLENIFI